MTNPEPTEAGKEEARRRWNPEISWFTQTALSIDRETKAIAERDEVLAMLGKVMDEWSVCDNDRKAARALLARFTPPVDPLEVNHVLEYRMKQQRRIEPEPQVRCHHEPYQGRCAHCDVPFKNGRPAP